MAPPKKKANASIDLSKLSPEEIKKAVRAKIKGNLIIGEEEIEEQCVIRKIRTNVPTIDYLGGGGVTEGRWTTLAGNPSACKTTTCLKMVPALQKHLVSIGQEGKSVYYMDPEGSFDKDYARFHNIDLKKIFISRTKILEDSFQEANDLIEMGIIGGLIIDSLDGLVPRKAADNAFQNTMGALAGALSSHLPTLFSSTLNNNVTTICVRQARVVMNTMSPGEIITFSGGKAYRHFQDAVYIMKRLSNRNLTYTPIQVKAEKTRSSRMGLTLDMPLGEIGLDSIRDLCVIAISHGIIPCSGSWYELPTGKVQGEESVVNYLKEDKELLDEVYRRVYEEVIDVFNVVGVSNTVGEEIQTDFDKNEE